MAVKWPDGIASGAIAAGIKPSGKTDLGIIVSNRPMSWAGTFTRNAAAAACVDWSRSLLGKPVRAIVANSGNANACTGQQGVRAVADTAAAAADQLGCSPDEILIASTGPIGVHLPVDKLVAAMPALSSGVTSDVAAFSESILTTDTRSKIAFSAPGDATVVGVAKGAAMCRPDMATMLAFLATDADLGQGDLQAALSGAVESSFNRLSLDGCESTNDSVFLLSTGTTKVDQGAFLAALTEVCRDLALEIVRDSEGGHRVVRIQIAGAEDDRAAAHLGRAVADSSLWRASVYGADPNWGRILAAFGAVARTLAPSDVTIAIGSELLFDKGEPAGSLEAAAKEMDADEFTVHCQVGSGPGVAEILSADLSPEYVQLNAEGT
ncbi:MAG: glutamate N-acetyltransferase / amino-acid N-acetyltransferase [Actinomycetota bacterium]|nr:glutamate N-acetyltransferase / amino-acid N-acetyltransferase [Actinomycetota bacterium]